MSVVSVHCGPQARCWATGPLTVGQAFFEHLLIGASGGHEPGQRFPHCTIRCRPARQQSITATVHRVE